MTRARCDTCGIVTRCRRVTEPGRDAGRGWWVCERRCYPRWRFMDRIRRTAVCVDPAWWPPAATAPSSRRARRAPLVSPRLLTPLLLAAGAGLAGAVVQLFG